eukprot:CAMPEP_0113680230 /NCGR_PEP_ID=MMETSP0038_2-20120614/11174_1 /TAXON_ID=2898 /ORGANISM="Cryptomonas paramecium" /LENGTH=67 /DNA_ID=CAMNT_0000598529 /DNA_START=816 /DNA_END=1015 /DNA_ORIENTATION=- /assembly_acc=CAM_ASM_000170
MKLNHFRTAAPGPVSSAQGPDPDLGHGLRGQGSGAAPRLVLWGIHCGPGPGAGGPPLPLAWSRRRPA